MRFDSVNRASKRLGATWRWPHFTIAELSCRCGGQFCRGSYWHDEAVLDGLEAMRALIGRPLVILSGHRCPGWNWEVGGVAGSRHLRLAADIAVAGHDREALYEAACQAGFNGLGLGQDFLHVDRRGRPACWVYSGSENLWQI
jgi:hypothetical protein